MNSSTTTETSANSYPLSTTDTNTTVTSSMLIPTYVGSGIAICGILLTLFSYLGSRKFLVKRTHMVLVNLCLCLLIYFIAYVITNRVRHRTTKGDGEQDESHVLCVTGAFLSQLSVLCAWFWIGSYWVLLLLMYQRPLRSHVHHFFIKSAIPCYGIPLLSSIACIVVAHALGGIDGVINADSTYSSSECFIGGTYKWAGIIAPFGVVLLVIVCIFIFVLQGLILRSKNMSEKRNKKRVKIHFAKILITTILVAIVLFSTLLLPHGEKENSFFGLEISFVASSVALGILLMILFCFLQTEIRVHWSAVLTRTSRLKQRRSLTGGNGDEVASYGSRKFSSTSRQANLDHNLNDEKKSSTIRMMPKDDTDLSTLGLIQIPNTPTSEYHQKRKSNQVKENEVITSLPKHKDSNAGSHKNSAKRTSKVSKNSLSTKARHGSSSSADGKNKVVESTNEKSSNSQITNTNQDIKRRSFSTSSIRPKPESRKQLSLLKRQSVLSNDSTRMTSFD